MKITDVQVCLADARDRNDRIRAYVEIVFDSCFCLHDVKVIQAPAGLVVCMPQRRRTERCECGGKNAVGQRYCGRCGMMLHDAGPVPAGDRRESLYADVAHPIRADFRATIERAVIAAYEAERIHAVLAERGVAC